MTANVGTVDRILRALLGVVLLAAAFGGAFESMAASWPMYVAIIAGVVMLATAAFRMCPIYRIFGIRTCRI
jgi:hypothetical protein